MKYALNRKEYREYLLLKKQKIDLKCEARNEVYIEDMMSMDKIIKYGFGIGLGIGCIMVIVIGGFGYMIAQLV